MHVMTFSESKGCAFEAEQGVVKGRKSEVVMLWLYYNLKSKKKKIMKMQCENTGKEVSLFKN